MRPNKSNKWRIHLISTYLPARLLCNECMHPDYEVLHDANYNKRKHPSEEREKNAKRTATSERDLYELAVRPAEGSGIQCVGRFSGGCGSRCDNDLCNRPTGSVELRWVYMSCASLWIHGTS